MTAKRASCYDIRMAEVLFYHLEQGRLDDALPGLLEKTLERGWRAVVRCSGRAEAERLDELLWTYRDDSFLPHSLAGAADDARQPVLICDAKQEDLKADVLFLVDGAAASLDAMRAHMRCVIIFDGGDEARLADARALWKSVKAAGLEATYWRQATSGRWEKQA